MKYGGIPDVPIYQLCVWILSPYNMFNKYVENLYDFFSYVYLH